MYELAPLVRPLPSVTGTHTPVILEKKVLEISARCGPQKSGCLVLGGGLDVSSASRKLPGTK